MNFFDTKPQYELIKNNLDLRLKEIHSNGKHILGPEVFELDKNLSDYLGKKTHNKSLIKKLINNTSNHEEFYRNIAFALKGKKE